MLKRFGVLILATILLFQANESLLTVMHYKVNKKYITDLFCINKRQPEMKCHGKCYLNKKLAQDEEHDKPTITIEIEAFECLLKLVEPLQISMPSERGKFIGIAYALNLQNPTELDVFHPPQYLA